VAAPVDVELGGVHAEHDQPIVLVFLGSGTDVRKLAEPVDAGVGPEVGQYDAAAQADCGQRRQVQHPVAPSSEGILPSTGNWTAAGWVVVRTSWLALVNLAHSLASWSIGRSFKAGRRARRSARRASLGGGRVARSKCTRAKTDI
jgi:hypothetical protein